jgi:hypothetical protein
MLQVQSLAPTIRVNYGNGIALIVGVYDLVDRSNGRSLRYGNYQAQNPYEPQPAEDGSRPPP